MLPIKKILNPTDFSEPSKEGFHYACTLARHFGAQLVVVHVSTPVPVMPEGHGVVNFDVVEYKNAMAHYAASQLEEFIAGAEKEDVQTTGFVTEGDAAQEIVRTASDHGVDLIVLAAHGYSGWQNMATGSVTEKVVRTASQPVLTVRAPSK
jgi:nucleotide-binding universal stress UspA family protein